MVSSCSGVVELAALGFGLGGAVVEPTALGFGSGVAIVGGFPALALAVGAGGDVTAATARGEALFDAASSDADVEATGLEGADHGSGVVGVAVEGVGGAGERMR